MNRRGPAVPPAPAAGRALLLAAVVLAWSLLALVAGRGSLIGDEAFYAGVALETQRTGQNFPLVVNGDPYLEKPPLPIWLLSGSLAAFGHSSLAARLPALLAGFAVIALVAARTAWTLGPTAGAAAALLLAALPTANGLAGNHGLASATGDSLLLLLLLVAVLSFERVGTSKRRGHVALALLAAFLSAWTKGAAGPAFLTLALPCLTLGGGARRPGRPEARPPLALALATSAAAWLGVGAWVLSLRLAEVPRLFERLVAKGVVRRMAEGLDATHRQGPGFYPEILAGDFGPGLLVAVAAVAIALGRRAGSAGVRPERGLALASLAWIVAVSLPVSKLPWYLLPVYPLLAWLLVGACHDLAASGPPRRRLFAALLAFVVLAWPLGRTAAELAGPAPLHSLEVALSELRARGVERIDVDPGLGFGKRRQLDATEYFLAESLRGSVGGRETPNGASGCRGLLALAPGSPSAPAGGSSGEPVWTGAAQPSGGRPALYLLCAASP